MQQHNPQILATKLQQLNKKLYWSKNKPTKQHKHMDKDKYKHIVNGGQRLYYSAIAVFASILGAALIVSTLILIELIK